MREWRDVLPKRVAEEQAYWEWRQQVRRFRKLTGANQQKTANHFGISQATVRMIAESRPSEPPIEIYFRNQYDLHRLARGTP